MTLLDLEDLVFFDRTITGENKSLLFSIRFE